MKSIIAVVLLVASFAVKASVLVLYVNGGSAPVEAIPVQARALVASIVSNGVPDTHLQAHYPIVQTEVQTAEAITCQRELSRESFPTSGTRPSPSELVQYFGSLGRLYQNFATSILANPITCPATSGVRLMGRATTNLANAIAPLVRGSDTIILVGYSQGNNYIEAAVGLLLARGEISSLDRLKIVAIGSPAFSAVGDHYINSSLDQVVYGALGAPDSLPANFTYCINTCAQGATIADLLTVGATSNVHFLVENYLNERIRSIERLESIPRSIAREILLVSAVTYTFDGFDRPNGSVGNGWLDTSANIGGDLLIRSSALSTPLAGGQAGIYRPFDLSGPVTVSTTITQKNGFDGLLNAYDTGLMFGSNGSSPFSGYGVFFTRSDQNVANSTVTLSLNGVNLATRASTFQFGTSITPTVTFKPDGSITGSIVGSGQTFNFSFGPRSLQLPGQDFGIYQGFPDTRAASLTASTIDNLTIGSESITFIARGKVQYIQDNPAGNMISTVLPVPFALGADVTFEVTFKGSAQDTWVDSTLGIYWAEVTSIQIGENGPVSQSGGFPPLITVEPNFQARGSHYSVETSAQPCADCIMRTVALYLFDAPPFYLANDALPLVPPDFSKFGRSNSYLNLSLFTSDGRGNAIVNASIESFVRK